MPTRMIDPWDVIALAVLLGFMGRLAGILAMITVYFGVRLRRALSD